MTELELLRAQNKILRDGIHKAIGYLAYGKPEKMNPYIRNALRESLEHHDQLEITSVNVDGMDHVG
jgi:hypothetical protein